jgi:Spy/CpxP family protein refolding chaperone
MGGWLIPITFFKKYLLITVLDKALFMGGSMRIMRMCIFVCVFALLMQASVRAQESVQTGQKTDGHRERMEALIRELYSQLNLSEDQKKKLEESKEGLHKRMEAQRAESRSLRDSLNQLLMQPALDMKKINAIQSRLKNIEAERIDDRLTSILEVRAILTPEQFVRFIDFTGKHDKVIKENKTQ